MEEDSEREYEKKAVKAEGEILGNKFNIDYKGSNKCPNGYYWVNGYNRRVGAFGKVYVSGHCRKVGFAEIEDRA